MYREEELEQIVSEEESLRFRAFTNENAIELSEILFALAEEQDAPVCCQIVLGGFPVVRWFRTGTDESNLIWLNRKKNSVLKSHKSSLRCGMEAELKGIHEVWHEDEENYVIRGGGFPLWKEDGTFVGAICVSGLFHADDHRLAAAAVRKYREKLLEEDGERDAHQSVY